VPRGITNQGSGKTEMQSSLSTVILVGHEHDPDELVV